MVGKRLSVVLGLMIGGGLSFALCGALGLKFKWDFGVQAPDYILQDVHINAVLIGLSALTLGLALVAINFWAKKTPQSE